MPGNAMPHDVEKSVLMTRTHDSVLVQQLDIVFARESSATE